MGAGVYWTVRVLRLVETEVQAYGVTGYEAMEEAARMPDVAKVVGILSPMENSDDETARLLRSKERFGGGG